MNENYDWHHERYCQQDAENTQDAHYAEHLANENGKTLHLPLTAKWFDMILSGEKKEEYRALIHHWYMRLSEEITYDKVLTTPPLYLGHVVGKFKTFDTVTFQHGYAKDAPEMVVEFKGITIGECKPEWSDNAHGQHFIISLGEVLSTKNLKTKI